MSSKNQYNTRQKNLILSCLYENNSRHMTADEIYRYTNEHIGQIGQATVYRHLNNLVENGLVLRFTSAQGMPACFQLSSQPAECKNHFHLICTHCDSVKHLDCEEAEKLSLHIKNEHGFDVNKFETIIYGICEKCGKGS